MPLVEAARFLEHLLVSSGLRHVYIGGVAISAASEPRATKDLDVVVEAGPEAVSPLLDQVQSYGLVLKNRGTVQRKLEQGSPAKIRWDKKYSFDLRLASFELDVKALDRAQAAVVFGEITLPVAGPEELIVYKLARFEDIDKHDIRKILLHHRSLDWNRIRADAEVLAVQAGRPEILSRLPEVIRWDATL